MKKWDCLDSSTGEALAAAVRKHHLPDFSNWQPPAAFERVFTRLEKVLRTSVNNAWKTRNQAEFEDFPNKLADFTNFSCRHVPVNARKLIDGCNQVPINAENPTNRCNLVSVNGHFPTDRCNRLPANAQKVTDSCHRIPVNGESAID